MSSAMGNKGEPRDLSEAELLAPWYVTGKLDEAETREVEERAKEDEEFARLINEVKREQKAAAALNEAMGELPQSVWARLEQSVEEERREQSRGRRASFIQSLKTGVSGFFAGFTMQQWQVAAAAAVALCLVQAGAIAYLVQNSGPAKYGTASGPKSTAAVKPAFIVSFSQNATAGEINALLDAAGASIVEGPNADGLYHLAIRNENPEGRDLAYKTLRASAAVKLVLPEK
jgi:hypothetical protein